jgi:hypothetical protein
VIGACTRGTEAAAPERIYGTRCSNCCVGPGSTDTTTEDTADKCQSDKLAEVVGADVSTIVVIGGACNGMKEQDCIV